MEQLNPNDVLPVIESLESEKYTKAYPEMRRQAFEKIKGLPYTTRFDLQKKESNIAFGAAVSKTSGSTGIPVIVPRTAESLFWHKLTNVREMKWRNWNLDLSIAVILAGVSSDDSNGNVHCMKLDSISNLQLSLEKLQPSYLFTYPSIIDLLNLTKIPSLIDIKSVGEVGGTNYSCEEVGTIALRCPICESCGVTAYHIMENIIVENHSEYGAVITELSNVWVTRYILGDVIETADPGTLESSCPRAKTLFSITKIYGRVRGMLKLPNGDKKWPTVGEPLFRSNISSKIVRHQVIQHSFTNFEIKIQLEDALNSNEEESLKRLISKTLDLSHENCCFVTVVKEFPFGKFEAFICLI